jgi:glycosyltransferase involved in cell wall biosynthesis
MVDEKDGMRVYYFNTFFAYHMNPICPEIIPMCRKHMRGFDLVHIFGHRQFGSVVAAWYARRYDVPYLVEPSGTLIPIERSLRKKRVFDRLIGSWMLHGASRVVASSQLERRQFLYARVPEKNIVLLHNVMDLADFRTLPPRGSFRSRWGISPETKLLLYLGRITRKKAIEVLIQQFQKAELQNSVLTIAGPANDEENYLRELKHLVRKFNISDRVLFVGSVYGKDRVQAYVDSDLFVLPSKSENIGITIVESVVAGTPVVMSSNCGAAEYIGQGASIIVRQMDNLFLVLRRCFDRPDTLSAMREHCLVSRESIFSSLSTANHEHVYEEVVASALSRSSQVSGDQEQ